MTKPKTLCDCQQIIDRFDADEIIRTPDRFDSVYASIKGDPKIDKTLSCKEKAKYKNKLNNDRTNNQPFSCFLVRNRENCLELIWIESIAPGNQTGFLCCICERFGYGNPLPNIYHWFC